jgi:hypothetical protein
MNHVTMVHHLTQTSISTTTSITTTAFKIGIESALRTGPSVQRISKNTEVCDQFIIDVAAIFLHYPCSSTQTRINMNLISLHTTYHSITSQYDSYTALYGALAKHSISLVLEGMILVYKCLSSKINHRNVPRVTFG